MEKGTVVDIYMGWCNALFVEPEWPPFPQFPLFVHWGASLSLVADQGSSAGNSGSGGLCCRLSPQMEVSADSEHFHVYAQEQKVLQFPHRHRPLATITRVQVLSDHQLAQVELAKRSLNWG